MSRTLGSFGTPHDELDVDFDYFGTMVRVNPGLSDLSLLDIMAEVAEYNEKTPATLVVAAIGNLERAIVHEDDCAAFRTVSRANRQSLEDLIDLAQQLIEAVAEVPTERPSNSSDGPTSTGQSSAAVSPSPAVTRLEQAGRPDLALVVVRTQEFRSA
jgi:hypothetical protein